MAASSSEKIDLTGIMVPADVGPSEFLIIAPVAIPILFGAILLMFRSRPNWQSNITIFGLSVSLLASFALLQTVLANGPMTMTMGRWLPPFGISFTADVMGALLAFAGLFVALAASIYSRSATSLLERRYGFYPFFMLMMAGVSGAFLTGDIFNLYVWFEVLLISSFGMIVLGSDRVQMDGTMKYAFLNLVATTMFLAATGFLYGVFGTLNMADIYTKLRADSISGPVFSIAVLYLLAFAMKAAAFPMNFWLPASYHTPRIVVSAVFAGLLTKVGVYALLRTTLMLFGEQRDVLATSIAWLAGATMLVGVFGALAQTDIRRILGYLVISGIGTMLAGLAIATQTAVTGVLAYAVHSMIVMTGLYLAVGMIGRLSNASDLRNTGGIYAAAPMFAAAFFILALSVSGLPPTSGFWGKFVLVKASLETGAWWLAGIILFSGLLTSIAIFRVWIFTFWRGGPEGTRDGAESWRRVKLGDGYRLHAGLAIGLLAFASFALGIAPETLLSASADAARSLLSPGAYVDSVFGGLQR